MNWRDYLTQAENEAITAHKPVADVKKALDEKNAKTKSNGNVPDEDEPPPHTDDEN